MKVINKNILGGWKYINNETGEFFTDEKTFEKSLLKLTNNYESYHPHEYFVKNYGRKITGKKLKTFICKHFPEFKKIEGDYFYM